MKKVSVYFTDRQAEAIQAQATHAGITFAEALRRILDAWLTTDAGSTVPDVSRMSLEELRQFVAALERRFQRHPDSLP
jgi:hypothetical protein